MLFMIPGCGYTTDRVIRADMNSMYVGYFCNNTWRQGLEVDLRRALAAEMRLHGGFTLASREDADSRIEGEILDYSIGSVTRSVDDDILMKRVQVRVRYRWVDGLSGRSILPWTELDESVFMAVGRHAEAEAAYAFRKIAQLLVQSLERPW